MTNSDQAIKQRVLKLIQDEPEYQDYQMMYQMCWRYFEICANGGKELIFISKDQFIKWQLGFGTVESILRALRWAKQELKIKNDGRIEKSLEHRQNYLIKDFKKVGKIKN